MTVVSVTLLIGTLVYRPQSTAPLQSRRVTISVRYQGAWSLTWVGYQGGPEHPTSGGDRIGFGNQSVVATTYSNSSWFGVSICSWVGKLDGSNGTLSMGIYAYPSALAVGPPQETANPFGIVRVCGRVVP